MKKFNILLILLVSIILAGCAYKPKGPTEEFKGLTETQLLQRGEQALAKKHYEVAIKYFGALDILYPFNKYSEKTKREIIYACYKNDDLDSTVAEAGRYIHLYPRGESTDYAYYMRGVANFEKNAFAFGKFYLKDPSTIDLANLRQAFVDFNDLVTLFPDSKYAADARNRMLFIKHTIARHELAVAKFYLKKKAFIAAANRAAYIVKHLEGTPEVKDALEIMVKSYQELGATKQAEDAGRVLKMNYPK